MPRPTRAPLPPLSRWTLWACLWLVRAPAGALAGWFAVKTAMPPTPPVGTTLVVSWVPLLSFAAVAVAAGLFLAAAALAARLAGLGAVTLLHRAGVSVPRLLPRFWDAFFLVWVVLLWAALHWLVGLKHG